MEAVGPLAAVGPCGNRRTTWHLDRPPLSCYLCDSHIQQAKSRIANVYEQVFGEKPKEVDFDLDEDGIEIIDDEE